MESLYSRCSEMKNPSSGFLRALKKTPWGKIYALKSDHRKSKFISLNKLKKMDIRNVELRIGSPDSFGGGEKSKCGKAVRSRSFTGRNLRRSMFGSKIDSQTCLIGIGHKETGAWMLDVTEEVVKAVNEIGACALSMAHCSFKQISPKVKKCEFCGRKIYKKVEWRRSEYWG